MAIKKCGECGGQVSDKAEKCPACGAPVKKKAGFIKLALYGIGGFFGLFILIGIIAAASGDKKPSASASSPQAAAANQPAAAPEPAAPAFVDANLPEVLAAYKGNELKGDQLYKGKKIRLTGKVDDVKNDIMNNPFVTIGTGKQFEIPQIQCSLADTEAGKAADLAKGQEITVVGEVTGLMMNVQLDECMIQ